MFLCNNNVRIGKLSLNNSLVASCQFGESVFLNKIEISHNFFGSVNFYRCQFHDFCDFTGTYFGEADFSYSLFKIGGYFIKTKFKNESFFNYIRFEKAEDIIFQRTDLSKISFVNTDISRINFGDNIVFNEDGFTLFDEKRLINSQQFQKENAKSTINLDNVLATYRSLRENYEFRLRYMKLEDFLLKKWN